MKTKPIYVLLLYFVFNHYCFSQNNFLLSLNPDKKIHQYVHNTWTTKDGLPSNTIWAITQTKDGYLWLGTSEGLARFDGVKFTVFTRDNTSVIKNNQLKVLLAAEDGSLWIGTNDNGLLRYKNNKFTQYLQKDGLTDNSIFSLYEDESGIIWIGSATGLTKYRNNKFTTVMPQKNLKNIKAIFEDDNGRIWLGSDGGLYLLENIKLRHFTTLDGLSDNNITAISSDSAGNIWIGTEFNWINRYSEGIFTLYDKTKGISNYTIINLYKDRAGTIWIGTEYGIGRLVNQKFDFYTDDKGLDDNRIRSIFEDREGNLWFGTQSGGINQFQYGFITTITTKEGLSSDPIWSVFEDSKNILWIGTIDAGINKIEDGKITVYNEADGLPSNEVRAIAENRKGNLWFGTMNGLVHFSNNKFTIYTTEDGLSSNHIRYIYESLSEPGVLWVGTTDGGLNKFENGKFQHLFSNTQLAFSNVKWISEDIDEPGVLWLGTFDGLIRIKNQQFKIYTTADGLSSNRIYSLYIDKDGSFWIGTDGGGLNHFKNGTFFSYTQSDGLFADKIWSVLGDDNGNLWMSCNKGIFRVKKSDLSDYSNGKINTFSTVTYGISDGMKTTECNGSGNSVTKRKKDGTLWYPTQYGVVHFNPDRISKEMLAPPVYIEQVVAAGKTIDLKNNQTLPAGKRDFEFHYTALNFSNPNKLLFKYKLEGYDEEWIEAGHRRIAYYTKIGYGIYQFKVIAFYKNRVFEESGVNLKFAINSFFYETWWFFILIIIAFSLLVYTIIRFKISGIKKRNLELKKEIDERKIVEEALRKSKERFQGLVSNIPGVVYRCKNDEDWTMMFISDSIYKISGYSSSEFLNGTQTLNNIIYHEDLGKGKKVIIDCVNKRKPFSIEYRIVDKQGEIHWVYDSGQAIEHEGTRDKYLDGVIFDITERKKVEVELAKLKNLLGNVVNSMPSILVGVDLNGRITQWNHCAETATGVSSDDAYGKKVEKVFPQLKIEGKKIRLAMKKRQIQKDDKVPMTNLKNIQYSDITIYPLIANGIEGAVIRVDDITERVRLEEMMIQSEKMMSVGGLAAGMAHEINNPLAGILQNMQVLNNRIFSKVPVNLEAAEECGLSLDKMEQYMAKRDIGNLIESVLSSGKRAAKIVHNMLSFSRKSESMFTLLDIGELLDKTVELATNDYDLKRKYDFRQIEIIREYQNDMPKAHCDGSKIQQVFLNILKNSAQAMAEERRALRQAQDNKIKMKDYAEGIPMAKIKEPKFILRVRQEGDMIQVEIEDNGPGMDDKTKKRVFEPFFTTKEVGMGTGLGLSVSYFIITENHKGTMAVESIIRKGTKFVIELPLKQDLPDEK